MQQLRRKIANNGNNCPNVWSTCKHNTSRTKTVFVGACRRITRHTLALRTLPLSPVQVAPGSPSTIGPFYPTRPFQFKNAPAIIGQHSILHLRSCDFWSWYRDTIARARWQSHTLRRRPLFKLDALGYDNCDVTPAVLSCCVVAPG